MVVQNYNNVLCKGEKPGCLPRIRIRYVEENGKFGMLNLATFSSLPTAYMYGGRRKNMPTAIIKMLLTASLMRDAQGMDMLAPSYMLVQIPIMLTVMVNTFLLATWWS